jgi:NADH dehydrogenase
VANAVSGAGAVVNAVSLYVEHEQRTFQSVHVEAARRVATLARRAGVETLVHISGIGAGSKKRRGSMEWQAEQEKQKKAG